MQVMKDSWLTNLCSWYVFVEEHVDRESPEMKECGELGRTAEEIYALCFKNSSEFLRRREGLKPRNSLELSILEPGSSLLQINILPFDLIHSETQPSYWHICVSQLRKFSLEFDSDEVTLTSFISVHVLDSFS